MSDRPNQAVSFDERQYEDGTDPRLLDIVDVPMIGPAPSAFQPENWLLDSAQWWTKVGECEWEDLAECAVARGPLWSNGSQSSAGTNNRIPARQVGDWVDSIRLIHVPNLRLNVSTNAYGKRVDGEFMFDSLPYEFSVTDPPIEAEYRTAADGGYDLGQCYLTVSVGELYFGYHYKLIAGVISKEG